MGRRCLDELAKRACLPAFYGYIFYKRRSIAFFASGDIPLAADALVFIMVEPEKYMMQRIDS